MLAIKQHLWTEWREQRGNLLGLWAGLVGLIVSLAFFGEGAFINHPLAPMWFAVLGSLAFSLTVTPRVFAREDKAACKGFLRRTPGGVHVSFVAKAVLLNLALLVSALVPLVSTVAVIYWLDARTLDLIGQTENGWMDVAMLLMTWHSVPLVLLAWGLPWRWSVAFSAVAALVIGASMYAAFLDANAFQRGGSKFGFPDGATLTWVAMWLAPWVAAWVGYALRRDSEPLRRGLACVGALALVHAPAWAFYVPRALDYTELDVSADTLMFGSPMLSPDMRSVFVEASNGIMASGGYRATHGIRIDIQDGSYEHLGYGGFQAAEGWRGEGIFPTATNIKGRLLGSIIWPLGSSKVEWRHIDTSTGAPSELTAPLVQALPWYPKPGALGLPARWRVNFTPVGLGYTLRNYKGSPCEDAVYDLRRQRVFFESDLPMELPTNLKILPGKWLLPPSDLSVEWREYNPETGVLSVSHDLTLDDIAGPALRDGRLLLHRNGLSFLYDPALGKKTPLDGGPIPGAQDIPLGPPRITSVFAAPVADWYDLSLVRATKPLDGRYYQVSLGWLQTAEGSLTWLPWKLGNHIFAATDSHTVLFLEGGIKIRSLDLSTGETRTLFPLENAPRER